MRYSLRKRQRIYWFSHTNSLPFKRHKWVAFAETTRHESCVHVRLKAHGKALKIPKLMPLSLLAIIYRWCMASQTHGKCTKTLITLIIALTHGTGVRKGLLIMHARDTRRKRRRREATCGCKIYLDYALNEIEITFTFTTRQAPRSRLHLRSQSWHLIQFVE